MKLKKYFAPLVLAGVASLFATGCQTYQQQNKVVQFWRLGSLTNAVAEATKMADQNAKNKPDLTIKPDHLN